MPAPSFPSDEPTSTASLSPRPVYQIHAGIVLSRPPQITRDLHPFEESYFFYQRRLNERLALPFMRYFYYKKGTPGEIEWKRKMKDRLTPARDIGKYHAYGKEGWNDELLVGSEESDSQYQFEALLQDAGSPATGGESEIPDVAGVDQAASRKVEIERPMERVSGADKEVDLTSLNRLLQRTLFLLVRNEMGQWQFPTSRLARREHLGQAAERTIVQAGGPNMNTWVVGHAPIGHYVSTFSPPLENAEKSTVELGEKHFFLKGRIMGGQATLKDNKLGLSEFRWLVKEEIQKLVTPKYWSMTEDMLGDR